MRNWKSFSTTFFAAALATLLTLAVSALLHPTLAKTEVVETGAVYEFDKQIIFTATLTAEAPLEIALLVFEEVNQAKTNIVEMQATLKETSADEKEYIYDLRYVHPIESYRLRTFSTIKYHIEARLQGNQTYSSLEQRFEYIDNRFTWQVREEAPFRVYWYEGDAAFAQTVLDVAQEGLDVLQDLLRAPATTTPIKIYIYPDTHVMQEALYAAGTWVAGHADPDLGVIVVALPPGVEQRLMIERRIPHEIAHIVLFQSVRQGYRNLPTWLSEGIASLAELYPNPDYQIVIQDALDRNSLLPMSVLCQSFPRDVSSTLLSYAQSASFVTYLRDTYGVSGIQNLADQYANGLDCERGAKVALGATLTQLDRQWQREALDENVTLDVFLNILPWLVTMAALLAVPLAMIFWRRKA